MTDKLFVYGTLLSGVKNEMSQLLQDNANFLGEGTVKGTLYNVDWFPALIADSQSVTPVYGHVYQLHNPKTIFPTIDTYEAYSPGQPHKSLYLRVQRTITFQDITLDCWVYVWNQSLHGLTEISSGNYLMFLKGK